MALHSFYIKNPSAIPDLKEHAKKAIMDRDPGVMCASLQVFHELIKVSSVKGSHWFGKIKREVCQHVYQRFHHKKLSMVMSTQKINKLQFCLWNSKLHNCTSKSRPLILVMNNLLFYCTRSITIIVIIGSQYTENDTCMGIRWCGISLWIQHEKRNSVSPSNHVLFCLLYKHQTNKEKLT